MGAARLRVRGCEKLWPPVRLLFCSRHYYEMMGARRIVHSHSLSWGCVDGVMSLCMCVRACAHLYVCVMQPALARWRAKLRYRRTFLKQLMMMQAAKTDQRYRRRAMSVCYRCEREKRSGAPRWYDGWHPSTVGLATGCATTPCLGPLVPATRISVGSCVLPLSGCLALVVNWPKLRRPPCSKHPGVARLLRRDRLASCSWPVLSSCCRILLLSGRIQMPTAPRLACLWPRRPQTGVLAAPSIRTLPFPWRPRTARRRRCSPLRLSSSHVGGDGSQQHARLSSWWSCRNLGPRGPGPSQTSQTSRLAVELPIAADTL